jgi:hypothetical protein
MNEIWNRSPWLLALVAGVFFAAFAVVVLGFLKNRGYRHLERMRAMELDRVEESFFAGRLLTYIPWQFWTSFAILVLLILASMIAQGPENQKVFLELTKYVTGAVIGSLFGKTNRPTKKEAG